jgi:methyl-accepting chemotaxis protein
MKGIKIKSIKSIKIKLILAFSILVIVSLVTVGMISMQRSSAIVTQNTEQSLFLLADDASKLTVSRVETQQKTLDMIALIPNINTMDWEIQQPILQGLVEKTNFLDIAVIDMDGNAQYTDGTIAQLGDRDYISHI